MKVSKIRSILYATARALGDYDAARKGTLGKRLARRAAGKIASKILRKLSM